MFDMCKGYIFMGNELYYRNVRYMRRVLSDSCYRAVIFLELIQNM